MAEPSVNRVVLLGRLTVDPEARTIASTGSEMCRLRIATSSSFKDRDDNWQERTTYHTVILWGRTAEVASQYLHKGKRVYIEGQLQTRKWEDREGNTRWSTEVRGRKMIMLDGGNDRPSSRMQPAISDLATQTTDYAGRTEARSPDPYGQKSQSWEDSLPDNGAASSAEQVQASEPDRSAPSNPASYGSLETSQDDLEEDELPF